MKVNKLCAMALCALVAVSAVPTVALADSVTSQTTNSDGSTTSKVVETSGNTTTTTTVTEDADGDITISVTTRNTSSGSKVSASYTVEGGTLVATLEKVNKTAKTVKIKSTITAADGTEFTVSTIGAGAFKNSKATTVSLPKSVDTIEKNAFSGADVKTLTFSATEIGKDAFKGCSKLRKVTYNATSKDVSFESGSLKGMSAKATITIKAASKNTYNAIVKAMKAAGFKGSFKYAKK